MLHVNVVGIVLVVSIANAIIAVPAVRMVGWALPQVSAEGMPGSVGPMGSVR
jgi:hypothetical protein